MPNIEHPTSNIGKRGTGEGGITLPLVHPIVYPLVDLPLAFCQAQNAVREGFEPSVLQQRLWTTIFPRKWTR
jgi:hypothetical protein